MSIQGKVFKFGDNINTDYIISGRYKFSVTDMNELKKYLFEDVRKGFYDEIVPGKSIVAAGQNFGCGSSREQAPWVIKEAGICCVIAQSFARIFYRNAFNIGLLLIEADTLAMNEGDELTVDLKTSTITNAAGTLKVGFTPLPDFMKMLVDEGGIINLITQHNGWPQV